MHSTLQPYSCRAIARLWRFWFPYFIANVTSIKKLVGAGDLLEPLLGERAGHLIFTFVFGLFGKSISYPALSLGFLYGCASYT